MTVKDVHMLYYQKKNRPINYTRLRGILHNLRQVGLLREEKEGRTIKYYPLNEKGEVQTQIKGELLNEKQA